MPSQGKGGSGDGKRRKTDNASQNTEKKIRSEAIANFRQSAKKYPDSIGEIYIITERAKAMKEVTRKAEMKVREQSLTACRKFMPLFMSEHLANDGVAVTVDKTQILKTKQDDASFVCILNQAYGWDYTGDFKNITLYFETTGNGLLYGGVYDLAQRKRITKRAIAAERWNDLTAPYTYEKEEMEAIFERMRTAPLYRPF